MIQNARLFLQQVGVVPATVASIVDLILDEHVEGFGLLSSGIPFAHARLWPKLQFVRDHICAYLEDPTRKRKDLSELVVLVPDLSGAPRVASEASYCSHSAGLFWVKDATPACSVVSCEHLLDACEEVGQARSVGLVLWERFLVEYLNVTPFSPDAQVKSLEQDGFQLISTHAPGVKSTAVQIHDIDAIAAFAADSEEFCLYLEGAMSGWRQELGFTYDIQRSVSVDDPVIRGHTSTMPVSDVFVRHVFEPILGRGFATNYITAGCEDDPEKLQRVVRAMDALGMNASLSCNSVMHAAALLEQANQAHRAPFVLESQIELFEWLQQNAANGTHTKLLDRFLAQEGRRLDTESTDRMIRLFDGRELTRGEFSPRSAFLNIQHPKLKWLRKEDYDLGALLALVDVSAVYPTCYHLLVECLGVQTALLPEQLTEVLTLLSAAAEYECTPARTVEQSNAIQTVINSPMALCSVCQRVYTQLGASAVLGGLSKAELQATFAYNRLIFAPPQAGNESVGVFCKTSEVVWLPPGGVDANHVDAQILALSHVQNIASSYPMHHEFFVGVLEVGVLGSGWLLPVASCYAMLLYLQQQDAFAGPTAALCDRLLEMIKAQPVLSTGVEAAGTSRECSHGAGDLCTHPACVAARAATTVSKRCSGHHKGQAAQNCSSSSTPSRSTIAPAPAALIDRDLDACLRGAEAYRGANLSSTRQGNPEPIEPDDGSCTLPPHMQLRRLSEQEIEHQTGLQLSFPLFVDTASISGELQLPEAAELARFDALLQSIGDLLGECVLRSFHVFYAPLLASDEKSCKVAFNRSGAIFFSLSYHVEIVTRQPSTDPLSFWFVVALHEVAHNQASGHNKQHEALLEKLIVHFLPRMLKIDPSKFGMQCTESPAMQDTTASAFTSKINLQPTGGSGPAKTVRRGFECKCGYTCGTRGALERHIERFVGSQLHGFL